MRMNWFGQTAAMAGTLGVASLAGAAVLSENFNALTDGTLPSGWSINTATGISAGAYTLGTEHVLKLTDTSDGTNGSNKVQLRSPDLVDTVNNPQVVTASVDFMSTTGNPGSALISLWGTANTSSLVSTASQLVYVNLGGQGQVRLKSGSTTQNQNILNNTWYHLSVTMDLSTLPGSYSATLASRDDNGAALSKQWSALAFDSGHTAGAFRYLFWDSTGSGAPGNTYLDNVVVSVPEPMGITAAAMALVGGLSLRRRR